MKERHIPYLLFLPAVIFMAIVMAYPTAYCWYISFYDYWPSRPRITTTFIGISNYSQIFSDLYLWHSMEVVSIFLLVAVGLEFIVGLGTALLLNRELVGEKLIRSIILVPMMVTPVVVAIVWKMMLNPRVGVVNYFLSGVGLPIQFWLGDPQYALFAIALVDFWQWTPFFILVLLAGLKSLPLEPYEAALVDGASRFQTFVNITFPMLKPVIVTALLLRIIDAFKVFDVIFVLTQGGPSMSTETISYYLYRIAFSFWNMGYASAIAIVVLFVASLFCTVYLRYLFEKE